MFKYMHLINHTPQNTHPNIFQFRAALAERVCTMHFFSVAIKHTCTHIVSWLHIPRLHPRIGLVMWCTTYHVECTAHTLQASLTSSRASSLWWLNSPHAQATVPKPPKGFPCHSNTHSHTPRHTRTKRHVHAHHTGTQRRDESAENSLRHSCACAFHRCITPPGQHRREQPGTPETFAAAATAEERHAKRSAWSHERALMRCARFNMFSRENCASACVCGPLGRVKKIGAALTQVFNAHIYHTYKYRHSMHVCVYASF